MFVSDFDKAFRKFADDGYNPNNVPTEDIYRVLRQFAVRLVPVEGVPTWIEQDRRRRQWPWIMADLASRVIGEAHIIKERNNILQRQLIEAKKEISKLKRNK